jgi:hypothetical protein
MKKYTIVIERDEHNLSTYAPDLPGFTYVELQEVDYPHSTTHVSFVSE